MSEDLEDIRHLGIATREAGYTSTLFPEGWEKKALNNVRKWGLQDIGTLLLATQEELGEVVEESEPHLQTDEPQLQFRLREMEDLGLCIQQTHEQLYEDENGEPIEEPPEFEFDVDEADLDRLESEVEDTAALLIQLQAAIEKAKDE